MPLPSDHTPKCTGNWNFSEGTLFANGMGSQFHFDNTLPFQEISIGSATGFGLPKINNENPDVLQIPALNKGNGLILCNNFTPTDLADIH
ncbi:MAG: hypothetical protein ACI9YL_001575 [Luteibaculaceae bacterium]|jgi:hypothetical protein